MKFKSKTLLIVLSAVLLVTASVLGTLAYLTDTTEVKNTFTVGKVDIKLDEAEVDVYGVIQKGEAGNELRIPRAEKTENAYRLLPDHEYAKDPTVTVIANSEKCFVRLIVTVNCHDKISGIPALGTDILDALTVYNTDWVLKTPTTLSTDGATRTYEFRYKALVPAAPTDQELPALFETIKVPAALTNTQLEKLTGLEIKIVAQAIQADGFVGDDTTTAEDAAWAAFGTP